MYCIHIFQNSRVSAFRTSANHRQQGSQVNPVFLDNLPFYKKEKKLKRVYGQGKKVSILWTFTDFYSVSLPLLVIDWNVNIAEHF